MRARVASFLSSPMEDPRDPYLQILQSHVMIPQDLYACQLFCSPSPKTFNLFVLSAAIFNAGLPPCIPRWLLAQIYPALGARRRALLAVDALKALTTRFRNKYTFHIYRDVYYDRGIRFDFSEISKAQLKKIKRGSRSRSLSWKSRRTRSAKNLPLMRTSSLN